MAKIGVNVHADQSADEAITVRRNVASRTREEYFVVNIGESPWDATIFLSRKQLAELSAKVAEELAKTYPDWVANA